MISGNNHSKKPSFSMTSDFSRQFLQNQTLNECKQINGGFAAYDKNTSGELSVMMNMQNRKQPKEIEELFESTKNFYKNTDKMNGGQMQRNFENQITKTSTFNNNHFNHQQYTNQKNRDQKENLGVKQREGSKPPANMMRVDKKMCMDDDSLAFNSLTTYKKERSESRSIGSDISSPNSNMKDKYRVAKFNLNNVQKSQEFQNFQSAQGNTKFEKRIGGGGSPFDSLTSLVPQQRNKRMTEQHRLPFSNTINLASSVGLINHKAVHNQKQQISSLEQQRMQQKLLKQQTISTEPRHLQQFSEQKRTYSPIPQYSQSQLQPMMTLQKFSHAVPKIQDKAKMPQAKKLSDESENETIDSKDMSKSFNENKRGSIGNGGDTMLERSPQGFGDGCYANDLNLSKIHIVPNIQDNNKLFSFNAGLLESQKSLQSALAGVNNMCNMINLHQKSVGSNDNTSNYESKQNLMNNSARKRAKWDFSGGKSTLQNSLLKNQHHPIIQDLQQKQGLSEQEKIKHLEQQYMAIKQQLLDLKKQDKKRQIKKSQDMSHSVTHNNFFKKTTNVHGVLSPDILSSPTGNENSLSCLSSTQNLHEYRNKSTCHKNKKKSSQNHHKKNSNTAIKSLMKRNLDHFKSVDAQQVPEQRKNTKQKYKEESCDEDQDYGNEEEDYDMYDQNHKRQDSEFRNKLARNSKGTFANVMKSQLQLGIRKLSINKQLENEIQIGKKRKQSASHTKKYKMAYNQCEPQRYCQSQMSYNCSSSERHCCGDDSSQEYQDCFSHPRTQQRLQSKRSSGSSKYYLANDSLCSCCRNELDTIKSQKGHGQSSHRHQQIVSERSTQKRNIQTDKYILTTVKKKQIEQHTSHKQHQKNKKSHREVSKMQQEESTKNLTRREREASQDQQKKKRQSKSRQSRGDEKNYDLPLQKQSSQQMKSQLFGNLHPQVNPMMPWINPQLSQHYPNAIGLSQSMDQYSMMIQRMNQNQQLAYAQSLAQPQVLSNNNTNAFLLQNQLLGLQAQQLQTTIPQQSVNSLQHQIPLTSATLPISRQSPLQNNLATRHTFGMPTNFIQSEPDHKQSQTTLDQHKESIEAIEDLIKKAKVKLAQNFDKPQSQNCKIKSHNKDSLISKNTNKMLKQSRNDTIKNTTGENGSYNSMANQEQNLFFNTQNTQISEFSSDERNQNGVIGGNSLNEQFELFQRQNDDYGGENRINSKRNSYQHTDEIKFLNSHHKTSQFHHNNTTQKAPISKIRPYVQESKIDAAQSTFNQSISSYGDKGVGANKLLGFSERSSKQDQHRGNHYNDTEPSEKLSQRQSIQQKENYSDITTAISSTKNKQRQQYNEDESQSNTAQEPQTSKSAAEVLWIDFGGAEAKKSLKKPQLSSQPSKKSKQGGDEKSQVKKQQSAIIPEEHEDDNQSPDKLKQVCEQRMSILEEHNQNIHSPVQSKFNNKKHQIIVLSNDETPTIPHHNSKESWAMDFSNATQDPDQNARLEALRIKRQSIENRLKKNKDSISQKQQSKEFTKEELLQRKKELLKNAREKIQQKNQLSPEKQHQNDQQNSDKTTKIVKIDIGLNGGGGNNTLRQSSNSLSIPIHLVSRLSSGQRHEISKKDMVKLSSKNYEQLPEIQRRKLEEVKKEDLKKRIANVKELEKKRRQTVVAKRQKQIQLQKTIEKSVQQ